MAKKPKIAPEKIPTEEDKKNIQEGINQAGQNAIVQAQNEEMKRQAEIMARRLGKLDEFIEKLKMEEGTENLPPHQIVEILVLKARHKAFVHTAETDPSKVLLWLLELVMFNAHAVFAVTKSHLIANNPDENAENPQKSTKKSNQKPNKKAKRV